MRDYSAGMKPALSSEKFMVEVAASLRRLCLGTADCRDVDRLARLATQIAKTKLWGRLSAAARAQGISIDQLALSVVGTLFCEQGPDSPLSMALKTEIESDGLPLFLRFKAVVVRTAAQELFHRWHETDPTSAKLWRNLRRAARHDSRLAAFPCDRPDWITLGGNAAAVTALDSIEYNELAGAVSECRCASSGFADCLVDILELCERKRGKPITARLETLFTVLRESASAEMIADLNAGRDSFSIDPDIQMAIEQARKTSLEDLQRRLKKYAGDGKLPPALVVAFRKALVELLEDCVDGGPAQSYYDYLHPHSPELREEEYRRTYRSRFEYLAEKVQEVFFDAMKKQLGK